MSSTLSSTETNKSNSIIEPDDVITCIEVMRSQEDEYFYTSCDYLSQQQEGPTLPFGPLSSRQSPSAIDVDCRIKMAEWCYQVTDFCKFNRETTSIAMSYLDRYLCTEIGQSNAFGCRRTFQLAAMTCLYTAVKITEPEMMSPKVVSGLSRGIYSEEQVTSMEQSILAALQWKMNPPTALSFVRTFLDLIPSGALSKETKTAAYELAKFQTELAVYEYEFVTQKESLIAFAAFANALEGLSDLFPSHMKEYILENIANLLSIQRQSQQVIAIQHRLYVAVANNNSDGTKISPSTPVSIPKASASTSCSDAKIQHVSPRSVSTV